MFCKNRARKKKRLTDPVKIIAFKGQDLRNKVQKPEKTPQPVKPTQLKKEAKILTAPTGKLNADNISIKDLLRKQKEEQNAEQNASLADKPTLPFTYDDLKMHWRRFAHKEKKEGMETLYSALTINEPTLEGDHVTHLVDNIVHLEFIKTKEADILQHLRKELKNYNLTINFKVSKDEGGNKRAVTGKDKFEEMAKRNPNLNAFKKRFKLDIDF